ncbi:TRAP transporter substrate-binding protein [Pasteurella canis]|uniref:TRAP-T family tripartite ATP-independent periplasmic transporter, binding protein n=1 Tax=Pasteurella canis TaxID=753 RepID=A0A379EWY1_9PAST|nr:TRAP transporter substrate-binding protein [Pasteurella canis]UAX41987.1 TRAP transporter substrate-binding protein [Pasteurella canis]UDW83561.1 TRAP transporter substrate-binding protein [Pasteurella canis]UEA16632.1 TRAP transporter substrate-binding protein [Pasteurella canis]SPY34031.1 TRAP-T family tripartite ATP-independent periplasmic transporter, binding protein [Pasteurella canis]SUC10919.1 TRAP-T family tripartite ATP-independent periplasmic transporter, binding protein [Pasteure
MKLFNLKTLAVLMASMAVFAGSASAATTLRFGYEAPRSDTQHEAAKKFNDLLKEKTKGEIKLTLFPDSTLGNAQTMISAVRGGTIDLEMSGSPNFSGLVPKLNVIDIPFIFQNREHAYAVLDGEIGQGLLKELEAQGLKGLAFWEVGFRSFTNSKHPVKTPDDIKGLKVRTNQNPMYIQAFSILGANPVPMPLSELYTALETRAVDAQEHPVGIVWSAKLYEVQKYLSLTNHGYTPLIVVMNKAKFDALSPALQTALVEAAQEAGAYQRQLNLENEKGIIEKMQKAGIEVIDSVDTKPFKAAIESEVRKAFIEKNGDDLVKQIDALAK